MVRPQPRHRRREGLSVQRPVQGDGAIMRRVATMNQATPQTRNTSLRALCGVRTQGRRDAAKLARSCKPCNRHAIDKLFVYERHSQPWLDRPGQGDEAWRRMTRQTSRPRN
jgi:hypothetical protein